MAEHKRPRIGIVGTGAIGGFYGLMLTRAGFEVHFLLRSEYATVKAQGLRVNSAVHGNLHEPAVHAWQDAGQMPPCDWLLVGTKTTSMPNWRPCLRNWRCQALGSSSCRTAWASRSSYSHCYRTQCICWAGFVSSAFIVPLRVSSSIRR